MGQRDQGLGESTLRRGETMKGSETPVLGELNQPKNSKIPRRNQEIANGGLGVALTIVLERKRETDREREREVRKKVKR
jgi:hypothetical protein